MLFSSLRPSARMWKSFLSTSRLLFPEHERRGGEKGDAKHASARSLSEK